MDIFSKSLLYQKPDTQDYLIATDSNLTYIALGKSLYHTGYNYYGQQGIGTSGSGTNVFTFGKLLGSDDYIKIVCSNNTFWGIENNGVLKGCGYNDSGQQGNGLSGLGTEEKLLKSRANNVVDIACSAYTTWYIDSNGDLYGCGYNYYGQQGRGTQGNGTNVTTFTKRASNAIKVYCNNYETWYIDTNGDLYGCGRNDYYQQGQNNGQNVPTFTKRAENVVFFSKNDDSSWYINSSGDLYGTGWGQYGQMGEGIGSGNAIFTLKAQNVVYVANGNYTTWYIDTNGDLYGTGWNSYGQQGDGTTNNVGYFTKRASNVKKVVCSGGTTWYITKNGDLYGCGYNDSGQQGNGVSGSATNVQTFTKRAENVKDVFASLYTTYYITNDNQIYGCGSGGTGAQGNGAASNLPTFENKMQYLT